MGVDPSREDRNREALEYYRQRSRAPGVAEGGEARNFYCMECEGVIPFDHRGPACPHCSAPLDPRVKRYFNWVEIDQPPSGDLGPLVSLLVRGVLGALALGGLCWLLIRWIQGS